MSKLFVVSCCFIAETDVILLDFLLSVLEKKTNSKWLLANDLSGEIAIIDIDTKDGQKLYSKILNENSLSIVIAYGTPLEDSRPEFLLNKPMRSAEFITLINTVLDKYPNTGKQASLLNKNTDKNIAKAHLKLVTENTNIAIKHQTVSRLSNIIYKNNYKLPIKVTDGEISLYIDFSKDCYYSDHDAKYLTSLFKKDISSLTITEIPLQLFSKLHNLPHQFNLEELLWSSTLLGSCGELNPNLNGEDLYHLKRWPNLSNLLNTKTQLILSAFMTQHNYSIRQTSAETGISPENIVNFINACDVLSYLEISRNKTNDNYHFAKKESPHLSLFKKIRNKLGIDIAL